MRPKPLIDLINDFKALPGITKKQAEKLAYISVSKKQVEIKKLIVSIETALEELGLCELCGHMTDEKICNICSDKDRRKTLVVVESSLDVFKFEDAKQIKPYYHVLGGLIDISNNKDFDDLNIEGLSVRAKKYKEIIIALSPTLEGIVTSNYLIDLLRGQKVTQLAQGIPLGAAMEYVDELTLKAALDNRKDVK